jgi:hypothetical protein
MQADVSPVGFSLGVSGWMEEAALRWLSFIAGYLTPGAQWVELGTWRGRSWACVALSLPAGSTIIAVDTFDGGTGTYDAAVEVELEKSGGSTEREFMAVRDEVMRIRPDLLCPVIHEFTIQAATLVDGRSTDVVFVDAAHHTEGVTGDIKAWLPNLKPGGLLCGHDYADQRVRAAVHSFAGWHINVVPNTSIWWTRMNSDEIARTEAC